MGVERRDARHRALDLHSLVVVVDPDGHLHEKAVDETVAESTPPTLGPFLGPDPPLVVENHERIEELRHQRYGFPYLSDDFRTGAAWPLIVAAVLLTIFLAAKILASAGVFPYAIYREAFTTFIALAIGGGGTVALIERPLERRRRSSPPASSGEPAPR